jgi:lipoate-protein ligase A
MAIDETLLGLVGEGVAPPTLRFYQWRSAWVSLGSGQLSADLDPAVLDERGWGLLRRASGGTAVLHEGQLGYALVLPSSHRAWDGDLIASYERLAAPLQLALNRIGVDTQPAAAASRAAAKAEAPPYAERICFAALGPHELMAAGRKIVGNSQIRRRRASAQHGVIQLTGGQTALVDALASVPHADRARVRRCVADRVGSLADQADRAVGANEVIAALVRTIEDTFEVMLSPGDMCGEEMRHTRELVRTKYRDPGWTFRR